MTSLDVLPDRDERLRFLFGTIPPRDVLDDVDARIELLLADRPDAGRPIEEIGLLAALVDRLLSDDPTDTWPRIQSRLAEGIDRHTVLDELLDELGQLADAVDDRCPEVVRDHGTVPVAELEALLTSGAGLVEGDPVAEYVVALAVEQHLLDPYSEIALLPDTSVVHVPTLLVDAVLTHHLSTVEAAEGRLRLAPDLTAFERLPELFLDGVRVTVEHGTDGEVSWSGPPGWLPVAGPGEVLTVRMTAPDAVVLGTAPAPTAPTGSVAALRAVYDHQPATSEVLPLSGAHLVLGMLANDATAFAAPLVPLGELAAEAGLEVRGRQFGHGDAAWTAMARIARTTALEARLDDAGVERAHAVLDLLEAGGRAPSDLRLVLGLLDDGDVLLAVADELTVPEDEQHLAAADELAAALVRAAGSSTRSAVAHVFSALVAERNGRTGDAESHLRAAAAAGEWWLVDERLAWYASDHGRAAEALAHLRDVELTDDDEPVAALTPFVSRAETTGRNEPCWCGSGRKTKQCHRDQPPLAPLVERVPWLELKIRQYLEMRGGELDLVLDDLATVLDDGFGADLDDLVVDVALAEGGWLARFVTERGPLLPPDEAELAAAWAAAPRRVYEIAGIGFGTGVTLRALTPDAAEVARDDTEVRVTDAAVAGSVRAGEPLCARVVPDGADGHRFAGSVYAVPRGREDELVEVLIAADPVEVLDWLAEIEILGEG